MTKREAKAFAEKVIDLGFKNETQEFCEFILKLLEQEPCEDCISRQYLLDNCVVDKVTMPYVPISKIENAPPVTPRKEPCEDAISRQEAIKAIMQDISDRRTHGFNAGATRAANRIKLLPPVTPKQKTGRWILLDECSNSGYYCSECRKKVVKEGWSDTVKKIKFCPNCGAKMESESEK